MKNQTECQKFEEKNMICEQCYRFKMTDIAYYRFVPQNYLPIKLGDFSSLVTLSALSISPFIDLKFSDLSAVGSDL